MQLWIMAAGRPARDYSSIFLDHDVMFMGPSHLGDAVKNDYGGAPMSIENQISRFARSPKPGDRIVLRLGKKVLAIGEVPQPEEHGVDVGYSINPAFLAVLGWELGHSRRVIWTKDCEITPEIIKYVESPLQMGTFFQIQDQVIVSQVKKMKDDLFKREILPLPTEDATIHSAEELSIQLFSSGMSNQSVDNLVKALEQVRRLYSWYHSEWKAGGRYPTEHEIVSHMVLPFLLALGWSHQQIAVEWNKVDIALFSKTPTTRNNCRVVIEVKGLGKEMGEVLDQPLDYIESLKLINAEKIIVTDGNNYFLYEKRSDGSFDEKCSGYLNINRLQREYILPKNTDVLETLSKMRP